MECLSVPSKMHHNILIEWVCAYNKSAYDTFLIRIKVNLSCWNIMKFQGQNVENVKKIQNDIA
jgi:hypothetical protein